MKGLSKPATAWGFPQEAPGHLADNTMWGPPNVQVLMELFLLGVFGACLGATGCHRALFPEDPQEEGDVKRRRAFLQH